MSEKLVVAAIVIALASGIPGLFRPASSRGGEQLSTALMSVAALLAVTSAVLSLGFGQHAALAAPWSVPGGRLAIEVDAIAAIFVLQIGLLCGLGAWYGLAYWAQREHPDNGRKVRAFYGAVSAGMLLLVVAQNGMLFLLGWEIMAASAFILVSAEDHKPTVRSAGYVYLLSTRAGTLCLFAMFALLGAASGSLEMSAWPRALASPLRDAIFVLGICGFGVKAGAMPLHVWLPGAHSKAPSHVSAVMSGVLIKTGIYGLVRLTALCEAPPPAWGYALIAVGAVSAVLGVGFAIAQHDLKRLLAYHSVENIGIICMGLGAAVLGRSLGRADLVVLGTAGALLHVFNHGLFKGLLFLSAGSVLHATGTREIDRLGGLGRRMPRTALAFLIGAVAICGLPPLNGLVSELLVYLALFRLGTASGGAALSGVLAAPALALVGALAVACFVKVFGAVFLGEPRTSDGERAHEPSRTMLAPMAVLAALCFAVGLGAPLLGRPLDAAIAVWNGDAAPALSSVAPLLQISACSAGLLVMLVLVGGWLGVRARAGRSDVGTWDCGYAAPAARMQYTASSFAEMIVAFLGRVLRPIVHRPRLVGPFPPASEFHTQQPDTVLDRALLPLFAFVGRIFARLRPIQRGNIHLYFLYILGTLLVLLLWR